MCLCVCVSGEGGGGGGRAHVLKPKQFARFEGGCGLGGYQQRSEVGIPYIKS